MKSKKKVLGLLVCAVLLVVGSVMGTMAYLTSQDEVTNTFTVGKVAITLDEAPVDLNGVVVEGARVDANKYKLMPGHSYVKDPTVHVAEGSEECWVFVKVENGLTDVEDQAATIAAQLEAKGWTLVAGETNVYANAEKRTAGANVVVFENFKIKGDVTATELETYKTAQIKVTAYAIQADGFSTAEAAWTAALTAGDITR